MQRQAVSWSTPTDDPEPASDPFPVATSDGALSRCERRFRARSGRPIPARSNRRGLSPRRPFDKLRPHRHVDAAQPATARAVLDHSAGADRPALRPNQARTRRPSEPDRAGTTSPGSDRHHAAEPHRGEPRPPVGRHRRCPRSSAGWPACPTPARRTAGSPRPADGHLAGGRPVGGGATRVADPSPAEHAEPHRGRPRVHHRLSGPRDPCRTARARRAARPDLDTTPLLAEAGPITVLPAAGPRSADPGARRRTPGREPSPTDAPISPGARQRAGDISSTVSPVRRDHRDPEWVRRRTARTQADRPLGRPHGAMVTSRRESGGHAPPWPRSPLARVPVVQRTEPTAAARSAPLGPARLVRVHRPPTDREAGQRTVTGPGARPSHVEPVGPAADGAAERVCRPDRRPGRRPPGRTEPARAARGRIDVHRAVGGQPATSYRRCRRAAPGARLPCSGTPSSAGRPCSGRPPDGPTDTDGVLGGRPALGPFGPHRPQFGRRRRRRRSSRSRSLR